MGTTTLRFRGVPYGWVQSFDTSSYMKKLFLPLALIIFITGCGNHQAEVDACWERGVAYFKDIGSYPNLQSAENQGKRATDVAWERCKRNTNAF